MTNPIAAMQSGRQVPPDPLATPTGPSRIPYPSREDLSPPKRAFVSAPDRKYFLNVMRMAMHASDGLWAAQAALGRATIDADIDTRLREMVILRVGYLERSDYELFHHRVLARNLGVTDAEEAAILSDDLTALAPPERALIDFVSEVVCKVSPSDAVLAAMRRHYSDQFIFDVLVVVGSYMLTARILAVGGVAPDAQPVSGW